MIVYVVEDEIDPDWAMQVWLSAPGVQVMFVAVVPPELGVNVTSEEMFSVPDVVFPMIVNVAAVTPSSGIAAVDGVIDIEVTVSATVAVVVPVAAPEAAVIVAVPAETPVNSPPTLIVATDVSELDQQTVVPVQLEPPLRFPELPSL